MVPCPIACLGRVGVRLYRTQPAGPPFVVFSSLMCVQSSYLLGDIFTLQSPEVLIVQRDYVIKHFAASSADPAFRHSVLPRAPNAGADGFHGTGLEKLDDIAAELRVSS